MRVLITGGAGFLGTLVARRLLARPVAVGGAAPAPVATLVLADLVTPPGDLVEDPRVDVRTGDLAGTVAGLDEVDAILHLAGVVSGAAEADFDLGLRVNVDGTRAVLEYARRRATPPVLVFSSSLAVFGHDPALAPLDVVGDDTLPRPQSSYGIQKFVGEQLVADYTRKGFVRGRSARLMTVSVRPGRPNAAASSFLSGIVREPLAGERAVCPVPPDTPVALSSPRCTLAGLLVALGAADAVWGSRTALNLPALSTTPREMAAALDRVAGTGPSDLVDWEVDAATDAIVRTWPARVDAARAAALGLQPEESYDDVVRAYLADRG